MTASFAVESLVGMCSRGSGNSSRDCGKSGIYNGVLSLSPLSIWQNRARCTLDAPVLLVHLILPRSNRAAVDRLFAVTNATTVNYITVQQSRQIVAAQYILTVLFSANVMCSALMASADDEFTCSHQQKFTLR